MKTTQKQNSILGWTTACEHQADHNDDTNATNDNHLDNIEDVDDDIDCDIDDMIDNDDEEETEWHIPLRGGPYPSIQVRLDKHARLIIRFFFGFVSVSLFVKLNRNINKD